MQEWRLVQSKCQAADASANCVDCSRALAANSALYASLPLTPPLSLSLSEAPWACQLADNSIARLSLLIFGSASNQLPDPRHRLQSADRGAEFKAKFGARSGRIHINCCQLCQAAKSQQKNTCSFNCHVCAAINCDK